MFIFDHGFEKIPDQSLELYRSYDGRSLSLSMASSQLVVVIIN
jgi:hypothetical protein